MLCFYRSETELPGPPNSKTFEESRADPGYRPASSPEAQYVAFVTQQKARLQLELALS